MIYIAIPCLLKGGTEFQTLQLVRSLIQFNEKVSLVCYYEYEQEMVTVFEKEGAKVILLQWDRNTGKIRFIYEFFKFLRKEKPAILHVQYMAPGALPIFAAVLAGVNRIIATVHQPYTNAHGKVAKILLRIAALFCNPFLSVSKNAAISWFGKTIIMDTKLPIHKQNKQLTLYNTIDVEKINYLKNILPYDIPFGLKLNYPIIGTVSRLRHEKGIDVLINAFYNVVTQNPNYKAQLLLIGDGPQANEYQQLVKTLQIENQVFFCGAKDWENSMKYMGLMDIVVVPSRFEGFGLTAAEAMAMGKPLIASDNFGLSELINHQENGLLFENENISALSQHIINLLNNPELAQNLGKLAQLKAIKYWDLPVFNENIKTLYAIK